MRQWDTKKQFKPDYKHVARLVFLGLVQAFTQPNWSYTFSEIWSGLSRLISHLMGILLAIVLLVLSPITFPLLCLVVKMRTRARRLEYLRRNRAADEDL